MNASAHQPFDVFSTPLNGTRLIEASAGTGKTWNICALYMRLLLERRLDVQQILVVTFTNAATAELRERIRTRLAEMQAQLSGQPLTTADPFIPTLIQTLIGQRGLKLTDLLPRVQSALQNFDEAAIYTIHGFCQRALADSAFTAGQAFSQALTPDDSDVLMETVQDFWRHHISGGSIGKELAGRLLQKKDSPESFAALLKRRLSKPLAQYNWPDLSLGTSNVQELANAYNAAKSEWSHSREEILALISNARHILHKGIYKEQSIADAANDYDVMFNANDPLAITASRQNSKLHLLTTSNVQLRTTGKNAPPQHQFFNLAENFLEQSHQLEQWQEISRLALLRKLLEEAPSQIRRKKRERRILSFDDLLHNLHDALKSEQFTWLADVLRQRYLAALVDEFQDTDPQQYEIFDAIYGEHGHPLFLVGDPKQAIYRFRNADLNTYLRAKRDVVATYTINQNQRSSDDLIAALNLLFQANPQAFMMPELNYVEVGIGSKRPQPFHDRSAPSPTASLMLWQLPLQAEGLISRSSGMRQAVDATAAEIARLLRAAQQGQTLIGDQPLEAGQIAVLVRNHRQGSAIREALARLNIGSVELSQSSVFTSLDAEDLERILAAILSPQRQPLLRAALTTELLGLDAHQIATLSADEQAMITVTLRFANYRSIWQQHGFSFVFRQFLTAEQVSSRMLSRPDGERRMTNLRHLEELLHQAETLHPSPDALLNWLQTQRREDNASEAAQLRLDSDRDLVQILTIHKSKGLEFPVVFCPFLWDGFRRRNQGMDGLEYHDDSGNTVIDFHASPPDADEIEKHLRNESDAEDLRLIYVAMTRAVHRCYVVAGCYLSSNLPNQSKTSLLNWLVAGKNLPPDEWRSGKRDNSGVEEIEACWQAVAHNSHATISLTPIPTTIGMPLTIDAKFPDELACRDLPHYVPFGWRIGSFSGLSRGAIHENAASDQDMMPAHAPPVTNSRTALAAIDDIMNFPKGSQAGLCIHRAFELSDFTTSDSWERAARIALQEYPQSQESNHDVLLQMLRKMIADVTDTPLINGLCLRDIPDHRRLNELEFYLPASRFSAEQINQTVKNHGYKQPQLHFHEVECYLKGFIDLVFEHDGRYYLLDWKSNYLGPHVSDYDAANLDAAMGEEGYHLQHLLYTVALNRYLSQKMDNYRYDEHFGGVLYLFVRGVRPDWHQSNGQASGVYFHKPDLSAVTELDALFASHAKGRT